MGIINITPDSFFKGSRVMNEANFLTVVEEMIKHKVDIIDIGGQSTRPDAVLISEDEELSRILPYIQVLNQKFPEVIVSIDTFYARTAEQAVLAGASIVNDVSGGTMDIKMIETVGRIAVPYVCMHTKGTPQTMKELAQYDDLLLEIIDYFIEKIDLCHKAGIKDVIIDPGFGFAKTIAHNFELLKNLQKIKILQKPILVGLSRKSTVYKTLGVSPEESLNGTTVLNTVALMSGAHILRVHDVKEAKEAVELVGRLLG